MKNILFAFALLLVFAVSVSLVGISSAATTIYVPDDYSLIQDAVNAATEGDTIVVRSNTYFENVVVNKPLSLVGEGMPTIDAQRRGNAIEITADGCEVKGFRCINAKHPGNAGIKVMSENNIIENNTCEENNYGIYFRDSSNNTISNNICIDNCNDGICLSYSSNNTISDNRCIENCGSGICLWDSSNNTISDSRCIENCGSGIYLWRSSNSTVTNNLCENNNYGIYLRRSSNSTVTNNEVRENNGNGIYMSESSNSAVTNNLCAKNNNGISMSDSSNSTVTNNEVRENNNGGIYMYDSSNSTVTNNEVCENNDDGIYLSRSSNNLICLNDFVNNTDNVYSDSSDNIWNSTKPLTYVYNETEYEGYMGNFWSDYDGEDADGNGISDTPYDISEWGGLVNDYDNCPLIQSFKNYFR